MAMVMVFAASLVWYSCTKDDSDASEEKGTIFGFVYDAGNRNLVEGANVILRKTGESYVTGSNGKYEFLNVSNGTYSIKVSKVGYSDMIDTFDIVVSNGGKVQRDIQLQKEVASLLITDMAGSAMNSLDFGLEESVTSKSFNIFNNGTINIECLLSYNCKWIDTVIAMGTTISPGQTIAVTVVIDRDELLNGVNRTFLHIISNNGSNELEITATGYNLPTVVTINASNMTTTSATCGGNVTSNGGTPVTERGICWSTDHAPTIDDNERMRLGNGNGSFSGVISGLTRNTTYYVRAYAINNRGTAYGDEVQFTTDDGTPTVTTTTPTRTGTTVTTGGHVVSDEGSPVTARGVCYGTTPYPDLGAAHNHTEDGNGTGTYSSTFEMNGTGVYYVRAYATNAYGTSYGEQLMINHPYNNLPTFTFNNRTYRVAPPVNTTMTWPNANSYCNDLTLYGYSDWRLPSKDELLQMYRDRNTIGGFGDNYWWSNTFSHSDSYYPEYCYYIVSFYDGRTYKSCYSTNSTYSYRNEYEFVRPIRVEN